METEAAEEECVPLTPVLRCVIANIDVAAHGRAVPIATPSDPERLHCLAELRLLQTEDSGVEQLIDEGWGGGGSGVSSGVSQPVLQGRWNTHTGRGRPTPGSSSGTRCHSGH